MLTARGQAEGGRAARLLGAAAAQRERIGWRRAVALPTREDVEAAAYAAGRALSPEEAYAEALKVSSYSAVLPDIVQTVVNRRK